MQICNTVQEVQWNNPADTQQYRTDAYSPYMWSEDLHSAQEVDWNNAADTQQYPTEFHQSRLVDYTVVHGYFTPHAT